ncbi:glycosyltransferase [Meridianimaribacter flavus]
MFKHFIITRFNLRLKEWSVTKHGDDVLSETWLANRFQLFETYCLPSVQQQTNQNFVWLLCFDTKTPEVYKKKIEAIANTYSNIQLLYIDGQEQFSETISNTINQSLLETDTHLITTRLDNDDAIHNTFVDTIQSHFKPKKQLTIDCTEGYQLILKQNKKPTLRKMHYVGNAFISLIEAKANFKTVLSRRHNLWSEVPSIQINTKRLWIQLVHQENISNAEKLQYPETNTFTSSDFAIDPKIELKSNLQIRFGNFWSLVQRVLIKLKIVSLPS